MVPMEVIWLFVLKIQPLPATSWLNPSHTMGVLVVLAMPVKNYLAKWWENKIQLAIQCNYYSELL